ncbi:MAG: tetratricopeptide repeat protein [Candidatus Omnitrophota bacterium]|nr:tetratricopeptide repeat protein [Candidatus Omnitrophota bacterium]
MNFDICHYSFAQDAKEEESLFVAKKAFEDGFYDVSLGLLERFLQTYPNSANAAEAELLTGECYFHQSRFLDALGKFEALLERPSANEIKDAALYWIAEVHFKANNFVKAGEYYKRIIDECPKSGYAAAANYSLGWCLFQERKFSEALEYFKIVEKNYGRQPQAKDAPFKIVECLYNLKDYAQLKEKVKSYLKVYAKDPAILSYLYFYLAEADYYSDNFKDAIEGYRRARAASADEKLQALSRLGEAWSNLKLKQYPEAEAVFAGLKGEGLEKKSREVFLLGRAVLAVETNQPDEAQKIYDELLASASDSLVLIQAYLGKADALYITGKYREAAEAYKEALGKEELKEVPSEMLDKLHYSLAWAQLKQGEFKEAIKEFQKIAKTSEDKIVKVSALCQIGDAYQDSGDYPKAQEAYDEILKNYPDSFYGDYVQYQLGITFLKNSNYDGAILSFLALKKNFPASKVLDEATYALGLAYFQRQDYNSCLEVFEKFQDEFKDSNLKPQALYLLGSSFFNLGRFNEAIAAFRDIANTYSQDAELAQKAEYEMADCFYQMGNEQEAITRFKRLRAKYPDSSLTPEIMFWLGGYYYRHNDFELARRYFSSLIQDYPQSNLIADAYYALASSFEEEARHGEALDNFKKVVALGKSDLSGQAAVAIADIYAKTQKLELALQGYQEILARSPELKNIIYPKMGDLYFKRADYSEALGYYRKALDLVPVKEIAAVQLKIAEALQAQGKTPEAVEEYLKCAYLHSEDSITVKAFLRVAKIYEDKEDFKEARNIYQKIISLNTAEAKYAQERLDWIKEHIK